MHIELSPKDAGYIKELVQNGYFKSGDEAVSAILASDKKTYEMKRERLISALKAGREEVRAGRTTPYTPELLDQLFEEAVAEEEHSESFGHNPDEGNLKR